MLAAFYAWPAFYDFAYFGGVFYLNHEEIPNFHRNKPTLKLYLALFTKDFTLIYVTVFPVARVVRCTRAYSNKLGPQEKRSEISM